MRKFLDKITNDTLKSPNGKWSRKSLTMFVSFVLAIILGSYIVISPKVNQYAIEVFFGFLFLTGGSGVLTVLDKTRKIKQDEINGEL